MIRIDQITPDDERFKQVLKLRYELLDVPVGAPEINEPSDNDRNPENMHMIVSYSDQVVSAVRVDKVDDAEFVVRRMVTAPEYQRRGIGRAIMRLVEMNVRHRDGKRIRLNSTPEAIPFYHALGYEDTGDGVEWAGVYHTEMIKDI